MRIIVVGGTGTIGRAVADALTERHEVVRVGHDSGEHQVDLGDRDSIRSFFGAVGGFDALVSAAGQAGFAPLEDLADEQIDLSLHNKLRRSPTS